MNIDHYKSFSTEDFILDDNFRKLILGFSADGLTLDQLKEQLPEKSTEINFAIGFLNGLTTEKKEISFERKAYQLSEILHVRRKQFRFSLFKYAATVLLIAGLGASVLFFANKPTAIENFASRPAVQAENAELMLSDGKRIEIESKQSKIEYTANGSTVSLNDSSKLEQSEPVSGKSFNQVIVPYGKRSSILLSDGSRVWLNSGSRLVYPPVFNEKTREVFLEGEAYFEVSKNPHKPFFVQTDAFKIKVLGTRFTVQAYKNDSEINAVLVEGKITFATNGKLFPQEYELSPNQKATLSAGENKVSIAEVVDTQNYFAWIFGYLVFENEDIVSLSKRISRYYDLNIEVKTTNVNSRCSGKLDLKEDPERILDGLSIIFKTKYEEHDNKIVIYN